MAMMRTGMMVTTRRARKRRVLGMRRRKRVKAASSRAACPHLLHSCTLRPRSRRPLRSLAAFAGSRRRPLAAASRC